ncbi:hypothetical protein, partial [Enterococcus faecium]|uniref:hypothetical protein n=1 Tax=Enterococcus faecium TaxID=1352 RepID=UPI001CA3813B
YYRINKLIKKQTLETLEELLNLYRSVQLLTKYTKVKIKYSGYSLYCIKVSNINSKDIEKTIT